MGRYHTHCSAVVHQNVLLCQNKGLILYECTKTVEQLYYVAGEKFTWGSRINKSNSLIRNRE